MTNELYHHGILGQKWGVRRFQNKDGSLTAAGRKRMAEYKKQYPEEYERNKQKAIKSGNAKIVKQWSPELSMGQLEEAVNRAKKNQSLSEIERDNPSAIKKGAKFVNSVIQAGETSIKLIDTGYKLAETGTRVVNDINKVRK